MTGSYQFKELIETLVSIPIQSVGNGLAAQETIGQWLTTLVLNRVSVVHHQHIEGSAEASINRKIDGAVGRRGCHARRMTGTDEGPPRDRCLRLGSGRWRHSQQQQGRNGEGSWEKSHISSYPNWVAKIQ